MWKFFQWANAWRKGASPTLIPAPAAASALPEPPAPTVAESKPEEKQ